MTLISAHYISVQTTKKKKSLLTLSEREMKLFIKEALKEYPCCDFTVMQYLTTKAEFIADLKKLTSEVSSGLQKE